MFITDFDGTLLKSDNTLCKNDIKAIMSLKKKNIAVAVATGRSLQSFEKIIEKLKPEMFLDYLIFSTGSGVLKYPEKKIIKAKSLLENSVKEIRLILETYKIDHMIHKPIPFTLNFEYKLYNEENKDFKTRLDIYNGFYKESDSKKQFGNATQIIAIIPPNKLDSQLDLICTKLKKFNLIKATSPIDGKSVWIEIFGKNVSKSLCAQWLINKLGINRSKTMSVGNDYNDEDLLLWSGTSFITKNAPKDLKQKFTNVPSNNSGAVKTAIKLWNTDKIND